MPRREIAVAAVIVLLALIACLAWALYEEAPPSFEESAAKLRAAGLPATIEELDIDRPPPAENAATPFLEAMALLPQWGDDPLFDEVVNVSSVPASPDWAARKEATSITRNDLLLRLRELNPPDDDTGYGPFGASVYGSGPSTQPAPLSDAEKWAIMRESLANHKQAIELIEPTADSRRPLRASYLQDADLAADEPDVSDVRPLVHLIIAGMRDAATGDPERAMRLLHAGWTFAETRSAAAYWSPDHVQVWMAENFLLQAAADLWKEDQLAVAHNPTARRLMIAFGNRLAKEDSINGAFRRSIYGDSALNLAYFQRMQRRMDAGEKVMDVLLPNLDPRQESAALAEFLPAILPGYAAATLPDALAAVPSENEMDAIVENPKAALVWWRVTGPVNGPVQWHHRAIAMRRLARLAIAAALYRADHDDALPPALDALVPDYLDAVPIDPLSGGTFTYEADAGTIAAAYPPDERFAKMTPPSVRLRPEP